MERRIFFSGSFNAHTRKSFNITIPMLLLGYSTVQGDIQSCDRTIFTSTEGILN